MFITTPKFTLDETFEFEELFFSFMFKTSPQLICKFNAKTHQPSARSNYSISIKYNLYHLPMKLWEGNIFSYVCLSCRPRSGVSHVIINDDAIDHHTETSLYKKPNLGMGPPKPPASDIWRTFDWRLFQTCSLEASRYSSLSSPDICWMLKHVQLASGWYASYWNAFLSTIL